MMHIHDEMFGACKREYYVLLVCRRGEKNICLCCLAYINLQTISRRIIRKWNHGYWCVCTCVCVGGEGLEPNG